MTDQTSTPRGRPRRAQVITVGLPGELLDRIDQDAHNRALSRSDVIRFALSEHFTRRTEDTPAPYRTG